MEVVVQLAFVNKLRMIGSDRFQLDSHLQVGLDVDSLVDLSEGPLVNLPNDLEVLAYSFQHLWHSELPYKIIIICRSTPAFNLFHS